MSEDFIVYREKTGCKQYVFDSLEDVFRFFSKPCYRREKLRILEFDSKSKKLIRDFYSAVWPEEWFETLDSKNER